MIEIGAQRLFAASCRARVERRLDDVAVGQRVVAEAVHRFEAHHLGEIRRIDLDRRLVREGESGRLDRRVVVGLVDEAILEHAPEHVVAPLDGARAGC